MSFLSRVFGSVRRRRQPVTTPDDAFVGTSVGRRLRLLHYVPTQEQMADARRLAHAELRLRESLSRLRRAGGDNTGLAREFQRTEARVVAVLEEPEGWLPRALTRWPSWNANVLRSLDAVTSAMT